MMGLNHERHKASKFAPEDVISNMPDIVITSILDRLPLRHAVRTSILSRKWRYKWTMLSQLVFDAWFFPYSLKTESKSSHGIIISRILLHLRGAVTKFVLSVNDHVLDVEDIYHWILFLRRKGIKDLTFQNRGHADKPLKLPTNLFSCLELKHLKLHNCCFDTPPSFHGFPNLLSLELCQVQVGSSNLEEFLTRCPLLESLTLISLPTYQLELVEIAKLVNLRVLSLRDHGTMTITFSRTIFFELVDSLPKLEVFHLDLFECLLTEDGAKKRFFAAFPSLKALKLATLYIDYASEISCAFELIGSFPNLHTLEVATNSDGGSDPFDTYFPEVDCKAIQLLQLRNVVFSTCFCGIEIDVSFIKCLLARSPFLKKFVIHPHELLDTFEKLELAQKLLKIQRAYPAVDIELCWS